MADNLRGWGIGVESQGLNCCYGVTMRAYAACA
jgi:hypothetical protein